MFTKRILFSVLSTALIFITGCKIETPPLSINVDGSPVGSVSTQLSCAASVPSTITAIHNNVSIPINLQVAGGSVPYSFSGIVGNFLSQVTISDTFENTGSTNIQVTRTYAIADSIGSSALCSLTVTVVPDVAPSALACAFSIDNQGAPLGTLINLGVTVSGGVAPYNSSLYTAGADSTYSSVLTQTATETFSAYVIYGVAGLKTASVRMTDSVGTAVTCSQVVTVIGAPSVSVAASPSSTVVSGSSITLTAQTSNFGSTLPTITFSTTSGGVTFTAVGNTIVVGTTDGQARTIIVNVEATTATQQATTAITLTFTAPAQSLNCSLSHLTGFYQVGDIVTFNVSALLGQSLALTTLSAQDGTVLDYLGASHARVRFNSAGYKTVSATASSISTGALCNGGATLTDNVSILGVTPTTLSCSAVTTYNPSYRGEFFLARAVVPAGVGVGTVRLVDIKTSWSAQTSYSYYNDATSSYMAIYNVGSFPIALTVRDSAGNEATCSTTQVIY